MDKKESFQYKKMTVTLSDNFPNGKLKAYVNIFFKGGFVLNGIRIVENRDGQLDILYPSLHAPNRLKRGKKIYAFAPLNREAHEELRKEILHAYKYYTSIRQPSD